MRLLTNITDDPKQLMYINIENYNAAQLTIWYKPEQYGWFFDLVWEDFATYTQRVVVTPNLLRPYKNILPFGLACTTTNDVDPIFQNSFITNCKIILLEETDLSFVETSFYG